MSDGTGSANTIGPDTEWIQVRFPYCNPNEARIKAEITLTYCTMYDRIEPNVTLSQALIRML